LKDLFDTACRNTILDIRLLDYETVKFLRGCEAKGVSTTIGRFDEIRIRHLMRRTARRTFAERT
jgi:hypothetical protein